MTQADTRDAPMLGEFRPMYIDGTIRDMIWNGEKWLSHADVYPLIYYAITGYPVNYGGTNGIPREA